MADFVCPLPYLVDLAEFYAEAAVEGGIALDAELCRAFAAGVADVCEIVTALLTLSEASGQLDRSARPAAATPPRTAAERRRLAAEAVAADPGARVVRFPLASRPAAVEGGSVA